MSAAPSRIPSVSAGERAGARLITVSATFGAAGHIVARSLAQRLGVPFLDRVTTAADDPRPARHAHDGLSAAERKLIPVTRLVAALAHAMPAGPTLSPPSIREQDRELRLRVEAEIHELSAGGAGVILGRAGAIVLGREHGLHVRLDGPEDRRAAQAASIGGLSLEDAWSVLQASDRARNSYVRRLYRADPTDPRLYHLTLDSTVIALDTVTELILTAAASTQARPPQPPRQQAS